MKRAIILLAPEFLVESISVLINGGVEILGSEQSALYSKGRSDIALIISSPLLPDECSEGPLHIVVAEVETKGSAFCLARLYRP